MRKEIDFTREEDYRKAIKGFQELDAFGELHIIVDDGNVEDNWIKQALATRDVTGLSELEVEWLELLLSLPYSMRYAAYLES